MFLDTGITLHHFLNDSFPRFQQQSLFSSSALFPINMTKKKLVNKSFNTYNSLQISLKKTYTQHPSATSMKDILKNILKPKTFSTLLLLLPNTTFTLNKKTHPK